MLRAWNDDSLGMVGSRGVQGENRQAIPKPGDAEERSTCYKAGSEEVQGVSGEAVRAW